MALLRTADSANIAVMKTGNQGVIACGHDPSVATTPKRMAPEERRPAATPAVRLAMTALVIVATLLACFGLGFVWFAVSVALSRPPVGASADGIVVLTGGKDRVQGGVELLEAGRAQRLLISGVHPSTRAEDIRKAVVGGTAMFECCVDLGHRAETTVGNALEAADWARANAFESLIVVTSAYHMPRSMAELDRVLPGVRKIAWPIKRPDLNVETWFAHPRTAKLLMQEYVKYIVTRLGGSASLTRPGDVTTTATIR